MQPATALGMTLPKPIDGHLPSTFLERGVMVPFTTPHLAGARVRPGERVALELIVPNMSGTRGVYILPLEGIYALCSPTLHDRAIGARIGALRSLTPTTIRQAARAVAAEGLAGPEAAAAATAAMAEEQQQNLFAHFELLLEFVRQVEPRRPGWAPPERSDHAELARRARRAFALLAPRTGLTAENLMTKMEELAQLVEGVGIGRQASTARLPILIAMVEELRLQMLMWQRDCGSTGSTDAAIVEATAELTVQAARMTLDEVRAALRDVPRLLMRWITAPEPLARLAARPDWLLNGWERICLLWRAVDERVGRAATLTEMVDLVPTTPREAADWVGDAVQFDSNPWRHRRRVVLGEDWRSGVTLVDLVARNEQLRALAPGGPA